MNEPHINTIGWQVSNNLQTFWKEVAPSDHLFQIYENETIFLDSLEGFAGTGIIAGDTVIIIATTSHLNALEQRLIRQGFDINALITTDQYIPLNAEDLLSRLVINGVLNEKLLLQSAKQLMLRGRKRGKPLRAFGEMVAIALERGYKSATIKLEEIWNKLWETEKFCLFCAYPKSSFAHANHDSFPHICNAHSKQVGGWAKSSTEIFYKPTAVRASGAPPDNFIDLFF